MSLNLKVNFIGKMYTREIGQKCKSEKVLIKKLFMTSNNSGTCLVKHFTGHIRPLFSFYLNLLMKTFKTIN